MNTDKVIDDAREKIAQKLASMDNWRFDDLKEHSTSFNEGAPTKDHYIRRANEVLAISGTTDIECPECGGEAVFENINTGGFVSGIICSKCNGTGVIKEPWEMGVHLKNGKLPENPYPCDTPEHTARHFACNEGFALMSIKKYRQVVE